MKRAWASIAPGRATSGQQARTAKLGTGQLVLVSWTSSLVRDFCRLFAEGEKVPASGKTGHLAG